MVKTKSNNRKCLIASEINTTQTALDEMKEAAIERGDLETADQVDETIKDFEKVPLCG